jgi:cytochrome oxidase Cu insertion factor (SCO1/SenC/PrrC family)
MTPASNMAVTAQRYKISWRLGWPATRACVFDLPGDIAMKVHDKAPEFTLQDENGKEFSLKELRGKTVILFFYPRANTPG